MTTHPYIPLYVDDFEAATAHLSPEEDGIYNRLLRLCWRTPGCGLPNDTAWIARKIRVSGEDFERVVRSVLAEFFLLQKGRWVQRRLKREYDVITRKKNARKAAGKKGGEAKAQKEKDKSASKATRLPPHARASPEPEPEPEKRELTLSVIDGGAASARDAEFEAWWALYPKKVGKIAARTAYDKARKGAPAEALRDGVKRTRWPAEARYIPNPATWLNQGRWMDGAQPALSTSELALRSNIQ